MPGQFLSWLKSVKKRIQNLKRVDYPAWINAPFRGTEPAEKLYEMIAHKGNCHHCGGIVKMLRDYDSGVLLPKNCWCTMCGQRYYMTIENIAAWEEEQWKEKRDNE